MVPRVARSFLIVGAFALACLAGPGVAAAAAAPSMIPLSFCGHHLHRLHRLGPGQQRLGVTLLLLLLEPAALSAQGLLCFVGRLLRTLRKRAARHGEMEALAILVELARKRCEPYRHVEAPG